MADFNSPNLSVRRGDDDLIDFPAVKDDGSAQDISGWSFTATAKRSVYDPDAQALFQKTSGAGGVVIDDGPNGLGHIVIDAADTAGLPAPGLFYLDLVGVDTLGKAHTFDARKVRLLPRVTLSP